MRTVVAWLHICSDGADVAGTAKYLTASLSRFLSLWADDLLAGYSEGQLERKIEKSRNEIETEKES